MRWAGLFLILSAFGAVLYGLRRLIFARLLGLSRPEYGVVVERDIPVMMADGVRLYSDHYYPKAKGSFPTILIRTPYGRGKEVPLGGGYPLSEMPAQRFAERGYHVIVQGARGCLTSEGEFNPHSNEAADGLATVDWIRQQAWFNGTLGTWGPSYLGYMQWAIASGLPGELKAMVPIVTSAENFSVSHPDGAFGLETRLRWAQGMVTMNALSQRPFWGQIVQRFSAKTEQDLQRAYDHLPLEEGDNVAIGKPIPFYREILNHQNSTDPFWSARDHQDSVGLVSAPVHLIGGWYDYYLRGILRDYTSLASNGLKPFLTIGPWYHGHPSGLMTGLREGINWFEAHLKGDQGRIRQEAVNLYVLGEEAWRSFDEYPPPTREVRYYLQAGARLTSKQPLEGAEPDHYTYDPADPTPALGGAILGRQGAGQVDNRPMEARPDVLVYTTMPLEKVLEVIGPVRVELFFRSNAPSTDFFGRLCDVQPDGKSINICDGLVRIPASPEEGQDQAPRLAVIELWPTACRFLPGHRLRLQISSGAHPRWARNLGTGEPLAKATTMIKAEQFIYHDPGHPSALILPVYEAGGST